MKSDYIIHCHVRYNNSDAYVSMMMGTYVYWTDSYKYAKRYKWFLSAWLLSKYIEAKEDRKLQVIKVRRNMGEEIND